MKSGEILKIIKEKGLQDQIYNDYRKLPLVSPSQWKDQVNSLLSQALGQEIQLTANVLNAVITKL